MIPPIPGGFPIFPQPHLPCSFQHFRIAPGKFGIGDPEAPDWISFESIIDGRAMRLNFSGILFRRMFTP